MDRIDKFLDDLEETFAHIREREGGDSVCGLCEYDGAYIGESGDWYNECPGFNKDDCFKLSAEIRRKWEAQLSQEGTTKDTTSDTINRQQAVDVIRAMQTYKLFEGDDMILVDQAGAMTELMMLPSAQTEEAIPVSWIEAKITQLISMDNEFAGLAVNIIKTLLNEWEREQEGRTDESN